MTLTPRTRRAASGRETTMESSPDPLAQAMSPEILDCVEVAASSRPKRNREEQPPELRQSTRKRRTVNVSPNKSLSKSTRVMTPKRTPSSSKRASKQAVSEKHDGDEESVVKPILEDNPFVAPQLSREVFLSNEAMSRQRDARNFQFRGDHTAPVSLRSGKTMARRGPTDLDEYGGQARTGEDPGDSASEDVAEANGDPVLDDSEITSLAVVESPPTAVLPNYDLVRTAFYSQVVSSIIRQSTQHVTERVATETEAVQGLSNLLLGTAERGEGNSCLVIGPRGAGKTITVESALSVANRKLKPQNSPVVVRLSGLIHVTDRLAIREMGRQISEAEGRTIEGEEEGDDEAEDFAPTTLPSHLLAQLTAPSPRSVVVILDHFDLFTEHPRQALLYCLLDVAQSVNTGMGTLSGRGVAVVGVTSRVDTLLLLEKRVKSRFSHRVFRTASPTSGPSGWAAFLRSSLVPPGTSPAQRAWEKELEGIISDPTTSDRLELLASLTSDARVLLRPFVRALTDVALNRYDTLSVEHILHATSEQIVLAGWGKSSSKLKGLSHPALTVLIAGKHLIYAGREEFNFAQIEAEYTRFSRTKLVGSGKTRWPPSVLRKAFDELVDVGLLVCVGPGRAAANQANPRFARVRSLLQPYEIVQYFQGEGSNTLSTELGNWGRMMGGHA